MCAGASLPPPSPLLPLNLELIRETFSTQIAAVKSVRFKMLTEYENDQLDQVLKMYEKAAKKKSGKKNMSISSVTQEQQQQQVDQNQVQENDNGGWFLLSSIFPCEESGLKLEVGLSTSEKGNFQPCVRVHISDSGWIFFQLEEWNQFMVNLNWLLNGFFDTHLEMSHLRFICCKNIIVSDVSTSDESKIISVTKDLQNLYLTRNNVRELCMMDRFFISTWIEKLKQVDFLKYYDNFLIHVNQLLLNQCESLDDIISNVCNNYKDTNIESYCLSEYMRYYKAKLLTDLNK